MIIETTKCYKKLLVISLITILFSFAGCSDTPSGEDPNEMVLHHVLYTKVPSLDPGNIRDVYSMMVCSQIFENLYQYHFLKRPYELVPLLAEAMPQVSSDLLTYTVKIKKWVYFQDDLCFSGGKGRELKAADFVFAYKRIANIKYLSQNWSGLDGKIIGLNEFREYTKTFSKIEDVDYSRAVEGLQTPDDYTLIIKLKKPWPQLTYMMEDIAFSPIAKEAVDFYGKDITSHPIGTGPYKLKTWRRGSYIELVRNPGFRGELYPNEGEPGDAEAGYLDDAGKRMPFADKVVWAIIEEYQPAWFLFLQGKTDASPIPKDNYGEAITENRELTPKMKQLGIHLETFSDPSTFWLGFNMQDPVLGKNKALRQAISYSIDREKFIEIFFNGRDIVAHGIVPPLLDSYDPNIKEKGFARYDLEQAKSLLQEAEKFYGGKLPTLKMAIPGTDTFGHQLGEFLRRSINATGIEVEVEYMDWPTYLQKMNTRSVQMFCSGTSASTPDAQDFLSLFYTKYWAPGSNSFNYSNPEFDKLYERIEVMSESPERCELYRQMEIMVLEDCPAAFLNHRVAYALHHDWYKNYKPHAFAYGLSKYRRVDLAQRAAYKELLKQVK
ncbi:MAG: ABC transporter substrate-binding protein [Planctomycetota bacterium]|nr:ABC transporter substrate-binding protein [Planctomycetota bacterium]